MLRMVTLAGLAAAAFAAVPLLMGDGGPRPDSAAVRSEAVEPAPAAAPVRQAAAPSGRKVRIAADAAGHFRTEFKLNGRTVPAMIDTGATVVAINRSTARRIGLSVAEADFTGVAETANGRVRVAPATIDRMAVGRIELRDVPALVLDDKALSNTLVGMSFLSRLRRYSVEGGALALEQ